MFYTNTPVEYWGAGRVGRARPHHARRHRRLTLPDNVRVYFFAGTQHSPSRFPPAVGDGQQMDNPVDYCVDAARAAAGDAQMGEGRRGAAAERVSDAAGSARW